MKKDKKNDHTKAHSGSMKTPQSPQQKNPSAPLSNDDHEKEERNQMEGSKQKSGKKTDRELAPSEEL